MEAQIAKWRVLMIKDILVTLPMGDAPASALDYAVAVASIFGAHLTGLTFMQDKASAGSLFDSTTTVLDDYLREMEIAAEAAKVRFEKICQREGISAESRILNAGAFSFPELLARTARRFDLTILLQPAPDDDRSAELMIDAVLLGSGRPILIVPFFQERTITFDRVLVCWDGSRNAARAVADGMPFLTRAKQIEVVRVAINGSGDDGMSTLDIGHHLSRHGGAVEISKIAAHNQKISDRIRSHAALQSADLIVMGGYGHSRLREWALGGETREMLESTAVPILMSH